MTYVRGFRGAITVEENTEQAILSATETLLRAMIRENQLVPEDVAAVFLTTTADLNAAFPAKAVRQIPGWQLVPLMCAQEIPVPNSLPRCIRVMLLAHTQKTQQEVRHVFLNDAVVLRPDLQSNVNSPS
ncbi:MAG: chorismate mutase [Bacillaceae bacterium G1]|nr:chorismate mutase [Bacillota bacterium]OJF18117.1 MAG: chorismate mutase [Bacillaceae bacterium G1]